MLTFRMSLPYHLLPISDQIESFQFSGFGIKIVVNWRLRNVNGKGKEVEGINGDW
jgi:hypothetical protein